jgi:hypothetical protein
VSGLVFATWLVLLETGLLLASGFKRFFKEFVLKLALVGLEAESIRTWPPILILLTKPSL